LVDPGNRRFHRIPTKQKRRYTGQGAKNPLDPQRPEKTWVPAGASGHELSRPKRVSWLPAYGMMAAMSIPVSCVGVKTHVFMKDLVVKSQAADIIDIILQLIRHPNGVHRACRHRKSRGALLSPSEVPWTTTKFDGMWFPQEVGCGIVLRIPRSFRLVK